MALVPLPDRWLADGSSMWFGLSKHVPNSASGSPSPASGLLVTRTCNTNRVFFFPPQSNRSQRNPACFVFKTKCQRVIEMRKDIYGAESRRETIRIDFNYRINPGYIRRTVIAIDVCSKFDLLFCNLLVSLNNFMALNIRYWNLEWKSRSRN